MRSWPLAIGISMLGACAAASEGGAEAAEAASEDIAIEAVGPQGALHGSLRRSGAGAPLALIVPGSGPTDRDGNNPMGVSAASYRHLADALAERGISTARIDKRGLFESADAVADPDAVTIDDYVADIRAWRDALLEETPADCIWMIGHSEGGLVSLAAAGEDGICGLVLAASPGRPLGAILREQLEQNPANAPILDDAFAAIDALENGERVDIAGMHPALAGLFREEVQGFLIDMMARDPAAMLAGYEGPVLIVQGREDMQVSAADAEALAAADPSAELLLLDGVNHLLKSVPEGDRAANMASYRDAASPIDPRIADAIAAFIAEN